MAFEKEAVAASPASFADGRIESTISLRIGKRKCSRRFIFLLH